MLLLDCDQTFSNNSGATLFSDLGGWLSRRVGSDGLPGSEVPPHRPLHGSAADAVL